MALYHDNLAENNDFLATYQTYSCLNGDLGNIFLNI